MPEIELEEEVVTLEEESPIVEESGDEHSAEPPAEKVAPSEPDDDTEDHIAAIEKETGKVLYGPWRERLSKAQKKRDEWREKAITEEKRAKELREMRESEQSATQQEIEKALLYAREMREQAAETAKRLAAVEAAYKETGLQSSNATLNALRSEYAQALEANDHQKAAQINAAMAQVVARQQQFQSWTPSAGEMQLPEPPAIAPRPVANDLAVKWGQQNTWFMPGSPDHNPDKAAYAHVVNNHLLSTGQYDPSTPAFYKAIDFYMDQRYPKQTAPAPSASPRQVSSPVAAPTASAPRSGVRTTTVTADDRAVAQMLGIDPKEIAKERLRMETKG